jgi:seryl-tRNA synthetase
MIDPVLLRESPDLLKRSQDARGLSVSFVDDAMTAEAERREAIAEFEAARAEQNAHGKAVAAAAPEERPRLIEQAHELAVRVKAAHQLAADAEARREEALKRIPNLVIEGVPSGGEENTVTIREVGAKPSFDFEPRDHLEIGQKLGAIDMERGVKVSGSRFYFLRELSLSLHCCISGSRRPYQWASRQ